ncbi:MAG: AAA family ATPase [Prevotella sp.]|jgi:superfamily I DNA/RNA helicase|nr:AAA family ATPase [Prevotella sp.]
MAKKDWMITESELDDDQLKVLFATNDKSCVVAGCAGSGKSVLALIKAQRIQREKGSNYQIVVFTKALCQYMNTGKVALGLVNDFYHHWNWVKRKGCPVADYTIVDEIQDFTKEEIQQFINSTNKNFFFFGDTAQSIYDGLKKTMPVHAINRLFDYTSEPKNFSLYRNYRLPIPIARVAQYVGIDLETFDETVYQSKENSMPRFIKYSNTQEQFKAITNIIKRRNLSDVAILFPHNEDIQAALPFFDDFGLNYEVKYEDKGNWRNSVDNLNFSTNNSKILTYHSGKGLQFETVFMPKLSQLSSDPKRHRSDQKALYVAMTRTYRNLYMMYSGLLPSPINTIPVNLYKTTEEDIVEDI